MRFWSTTWSSPDRPKTVGRFPVSISAPCCAMLEPMVAITRAAAWLRSTGSTELIRRSSSAYWSRSVTSSLA